jgi:site-specific DNA-methyltransferase (adenine-specific)
MGEGTLQDVLDGRAAWCVVEGECLEVLRQIPSATVDALVTDPPYSSGGAFRGDRMLKTSDKYVMTGTQVQRPEFLGDNRDQRSFAYWCALWSAESGRACKPGAIIAQFTDWRQLPTTTDSLQAGGWVWRGIAVWNKGPSARPAMGRFRNQCEFIAWGTNGEAVDSQAVGCLPGAWDCAVNSDEKHHITGKPESVMAGVVAICPPGGVVLDPFAGSGTTGVAALRLGRRAILIEKSPEYAAIARDRMRAEERGQTLKQFRAGQQTLWEKTP